MAKEGWKSIPRTLVLLLEDASLGSPEMRVWEEKSENTGESPRIPSRLFCGDDGPYRSQDLVEYRPHYC